MGSAHLTARANVGSSLTPGVKQYSVLWSFGNGQDGRSSHAGLIADTDGALYGTTWSGGAYGYGSVFKLTPSGASYRERILWSFGNVPDGQSPYAGLIADASGALYGTTYYGGAYSSGTVFKLTPSGSSYTERVLWSFGSEQDGQTPLAGLIAKGGILFGTTVLGGAQGRGTVFQLTPSGSSYTERVLWSFDNVSTGTNPEAGLIAKGSALYGTTWVGGAYNYYGTVFQLTPSGSSYTEHVLWSFGSVPDGQSPLAGLIAKDGALYGTTRFGGAHGYGTVFKLTPSGSGYTERVLWSFVHGRDGFEPSAGLIAKSGALYGTTAYGGAYGYGTVFKLTPSGSGYTERVLWSFGNGPDGGEPFAGLIAKAGALYGTTVTGGAYGYGTVFRLIPT